MIQYICLNANVRFEVEHLCCIVPQKTIFTSKKVSYRFYSGQWFCAGVELDKLVIRQVASRITRRITSGIKVEKRTSILSSSEDITYIDESRIHYAGTRLLLRAD